MDGQDQKGNHACRLQSETAPDCHKWNGERGRCGYLMPVMLEHRLRSSICCAAAWWSGFLARTGPANRLQRRPAVLKRAVSVLPTRRNRDWAHQGET